ncbi:flocculation-associated PEP-CTERM protein PepA [Methyloversatilis thermotolerans]|uniref:flocculation-associated PEP-CTERM protein PepA n=1 Tax=Methyloversatilis thermotolerans TaxID=1346290 RepID=UPI00035C5A17|nr:flocculation-associated PEP-CTERM protein PepA [Methyloversatilis thermotolerans]
MMKQLKTLAAAAALFAGSSAAMATTLTNSAGSFNNWGGFDWASNGTAVVDGYLPVAGDTFELTYYAKAGTITDSIGNIIAGATVGLLTNQYEYTILVTLTERVETISADLSTATFSILSGSFSIWYDTTPDTNMVTGTGITDGILLISGDIAADASGGFNVITGGNATLVGENIVTNTTYISPTLESTTATTTLQIGATQTGWLPPTGMPDTAGGSQPLPDRPILLQADANQIFTPTTVPEPGTMALLGVAALGMGLARARKKA